MLKRHPTRNPHLDKRTGYWMIFLEDGSRTTLHRRIFSEHVGHDLQKSDVVHHRNGNKTDNQIENLELKARSSHASDHGKKSDAELYEVRECLHCGADFRVRRKYIRCKKRKTPYAYCSRSCGTEAQWARIKAQT